MSTWIWAVIAYAIVGILYAVKKMLDDKFKPREKKDRIIYFFLDFLLWPLVLFIGECK